MCAKGTGTGSHFLSFVTSRNLLKATLVTTYQSNIIPLGYEHKKTPYHLAAVKTYMNTFWNDKDYRGSLLSLHSRLRTWAKKQVSICVPNKSCCYRLGCCGLDDKDVRLHLVVPCLHTHTEVTMRPTVPAVTLCLFVVSFCSWSLCNYCLGPFIKAALEPELVSQQIRQDISVSRRVTALKKEFLLSRRRSFMLISW